MTIEKYGSVRKIGLCFPISSFNLVNKNEKTKSGNVSTELIRDRGIVTKIIRKWLFSTSILIFYRKKEVNIFKN